MVKHLDATFCYSYGVRCYYINKFGNASAINNKEAETKLMLCLENYEFIEKAKYDQEKDKITIRSKNFNVTISPASKFLDVPNVEVTYGENNLERRKITQMPRQNP